MRAVIVGEHNCAIDECPGGKCLYNGDFEIVISWDQAVTVCSTLQPDLSTIRVFVCAMSPEVERRILNFQGFWDKAEYSGREKFRWRFAFEAIDAHEVVALLIQWFPGLEVVNRNGS